MHDQICYSVPVMTSMLEFHSFPLPYKRLQVLHSVLVKGLHIELLLSYAVYPQMFHYI